LRGFSHDVPQAEVIAVAGAMTILKLPSSNANK